ncbi:MAG: hypothetical protein HRT87_01080 [Legionellales bacterium]|nr:hypothetical protein [Legionellales bacterium]
MIKKKIFKNRMFDKKKVFLFLVFALVSGYLLLQNFDEVPVTTEMVNSGRTVFSKDLVPTETLKNLLKEENLDYSSYPGILKTTQSNWLRNVNKERWDINHSSTNKYEEYFRNLGMIEPVYPTDDNFTYAVLLGATVPSMIKRMEFLKTLLQEYQITFKKLVILTGARELHPIGDFDKMGEHEYAEQIKLLKTEVEAARWLADEIFVKTKLIKLDKIQIVNATDFSGSRPTTDDTIRTWLKSNPAPGRILAISHQPYVGRQGAVLQSLLPEGFRVEVVGFGKSSEVGESVLFDSLARWIYQLGKLRNSKVVSS